LFLTFSNRETAFILVVKQAAFAEAGAAIIATELVTVPDVIPAFAAFYGSVDELKHRRFVIQRASGLKDVRTINLRGSTHAA
jgi:hypothetical protein